MTDPSGGFNLETQLALAKYYVENERSKAEWSQVVLKIGKLQKDAEGAGKYQICAVNAATNAQVRLFVDAAVVESQHVGRMSELLAKAGVKVAARDLNMYFLIHDRASSEPASGPA